MTRESPSGEEEQQSGQGECERTEPRERQAAVQPGCVPRLHRRDGVDPESVRIEVDGRHRRAVPASVAGTVSAVRGPPSPELPGALAPLGGVASPSLRTVTGARMTGETI
jgi:hypothetical protein